MALVQFKTTPEEDKMIEELKPIFRTSTRTKVFKKCLEKTYEFFNLKKQHRQTE